MVWLHLETHSLVRSGWVERFRGGLEEVVGGLRTPDGIRIPAGVAIVRGDEVVEFDHLLRGVADVAVLRGVVFVDALLSRFVPLREEELGGDGHFVCGGSDGGDHWIF